MHLPQPSELHLPQLSLGPPLFFAVLLSQSLDHPHSLAHPLAQLPIFFGPLPRNTRIPYHYSRPFISILQRAHFLSLTVIVETGLRWQLFDRTFVWSHLRMLLALWLLWAFFGVRVNLSVERRLLGLRVCGSVRQGRTIVGQMCLWF